jgi:predicted enzyme related to lactoylglutathione lyase
MGAQNGWSVYLASDDAQATVDKATAKGAQVIVAPMEVPQQGTMAFVVDPGQAAVGIWQPAQHKGFGVLAEHGAPAWFELHTRDYEPTLRFYEDVFGWDTHVASDAPEFRYATFGEGENQYAGVMDDTVLGSDGPPPHWSVYFGVVDTDKAAARVGELGGSVLEAPVDTPYGRLARVADPIGVQFRIIDGVE